MRTILLIAYHYPPEGSSSGVQRTLAFSRYLSGHGWTPVVLTAHPRAYTVTRPDQLGDVPPEVTVRRAFALDSACHLSIAGHYAKLTALPDRWVSWWMGAVPAGVSLLRRFGVQVIWSTYPIATAHLIGWTLQRISGLPWIADFRDTMTEPGHPPDESQRRVYRWIERNTMRRCARAVFTTSGALQMYAERYPTVPPDRLAVIANGYDEESFAQAVQAGPGAERGRPDAGSQLVLLHSGVLYPAERDPTSFYDAIARLQRTGAISPATLRVVLRATGHDEFHRRLIRQRHIEEIVKLEPALPYREALSEMSRADGLLIFQASSCNQQIPAKAYEYLRAGRPVLALTDPKGDTAALFRSANAGSISPLDDEQAISEGLRNFVADIREGKATGADDEEARKHSRRARTADLAVLLEDIARNGKMN